MHDLVLHEETNIELTLQAFMMAPVSFAIDVGETPPLVPEPSSAALLGLGLCLLVARCRRAAPRFG